MAVVTKLLELLQLFPFSCQTLAIFRPTPPSLARFYDSSANLIMSSIHYDDDKPNFRNKEV